MRTVIAYIRRLKKKFSKHIPLIEITISKSCLLHNLRSFQNAYPGMLIAPVLKSNAYGHGLREVASLLDTEDLPFFVVDSLFEAHTLRGVGIKTDILIIGYTHIDAICKNKIDCAFTITSLDQLQELSTRIKRQTRIHLKIDTGMHRQGVLPSELSSALEFIEKNEHILLEGICSHFADADSHDASFSNEQIKSWEKAVSLCKERFPEIPYIHVSATAGARYAEKAQGNVIRLGLGLYGIDPNPIAPLSLKPVLEMRSRISSIRSLTTGDRVGYNCTFVAPKPMKVATVPVGYFEGVDRRLSNHGVFKIGEAYSNIVGRVSMNITSIDVTALSDVQRDDAVTIIGRSPTDKNSVAEIANDAGTIPWEILVHIPPHLYRKVVD